MADPLVFEPYLRPMIWGGRRLAESLGKRLPTADPYGEAWELSGHPQHVSRVAEGPLAGRSLEDLWHRDDLARWGSSSRADRFPLLVKLLDCQSLLSVQVHPDDRLARQLLGNELGKTEAWILLDVAPTACIYAGLRPGVDRAELERHLAAGTVEACLHRISPQVGDVLFLPAGTVHAVGLGVVMAEVQQASDATFRLHDWGRLDAQGRPRQLHLAESFAAIDWSRGPLEPRRQFPRETVAPGVERETLVDCEQFRLERWYLTNAAPVESLGTWSIALVLAGSAELRGSGGYQRRFQAGETVLLPAQAAGLAWHPTSAATLLIARPPTGPSEGNR